MIDVRFCLIFTLILCCSSKKCRILGLEGGGDKGAFEAGVLKYAFNKLPAEEINYDVISGVSVGAIGTMALAQYPRGEEIQAVEWMVDMWRNIRGTDVYVNWPEGPIIGFFDRPSMFNSSVLNDFFNKYLTKPPQRPVNIGTTDANTGKFTRLDDRMFNETKDFIKEVLSSSAMPGLFLYQNFMGTTFIDGGSQINLDIGGAVNRCMQEGFAEEDIVIDVVLSNSAVNLGTVNDNSNVLHLYNQVNEISSYHQTFRDVRTAFTSYPKADFRYLFLPLSALPYAIEPIFFRPDQIEQMITQGQEDGQTIINWGPGVSFEKYLKQENMMKY